MSLVILAETQHLLTVLGGAVSSVWGFAHLGTGYFLGFISSTFVEPRTAFLSAGFLIDGVLILTFSVALLAGWSGSSLMGVVAYGLSGVLGVGPVRISAPLWGAPFIATGSVTVLYFLFKTIRPERKSLPVRC